MIHVKSIGYVQTKQQQLFLHLGTKLNFLGHSSHRSLIAHVCVLSIPEDRHFDTVGCMLLKDWFALLDISMISALEQEVPAFPSRRTGFHE